MMLESISSRQRLLANCTLSGILYVADKRSIQEGTCAICEISPCSDSCSSLSSAIFTQAELIAMLPEQPGDHGGPERRCRCHWFSRLCLPSHWGQTAQPGHPGFLWYEPGGIKTA